MKLVADDDAILISSPSFVTEKVFVRAAEKGKRFKLYVIGKNQAALRDMAVRLQDRGIEVVFGHVNNISYYMTLVNKIMLTGYCVYSNGNLLSDAGNAVVAFFANKFRKPTYALTRTFKFSEKTQIDTLSANESRLLVDEVAKTEQFDLVYDLVPGKYLSVLVTEIGQMPVTCVPVVLREFKIDFDKTTYEE